VYTLLLTNLIFYVHSAAIPQRADMVLERCTNAVATPFGVTGALKCFLKLISVYLKQKKIPIIYTDRPNLLMHVLFQLCHAPAAEMEELEFNKHWDVMSNVLSKIKHLAFSVFKRYELLFGSELDYQIMCSWVHYHD